LEKALLKGFWNCKEMLHYKMLTIWRDPNLLTIKHFCGASMAHSAFNQPSKSVLPFKIEVDIFVYYGIKEIWNIS
jgi:hypothetical protein